MKTKPLVVLLIIGLAVVAVVSTFSAGNGAKLTSTSIPVIALVRIDGALVTGLGGSSFLETSSGSDSIVSLLARIKADPNVRAVVLRVNSPGGTPAASQEIAEAIAGVQSAGKIVVTSMADVAASGAYWVAAATDHIVADPGTITGSIGVIWRFANYEELYRKLGIDHVTFTSGPYKDMGSTTRDLSSQEEEIVRGIIDEMFNQFVDAVASGRRMAREEVLTLSDGRIFTGSQALEAGLVDSLGGLRPSIEKAAELAGVADSYRVEEYGRRSAWQMLLGEVGSLIGGLKAVWLPAGSTIFGP